MKNRKKINYLVFIMLIGAFIAPLTLKWFSRETPLSAPLSTTKALVFPQAQAFFADQLKKEENSLWQEIKKGFGVELQQLHKNQQNSWKQAPNVPKKNEPIYQLVYEVAKEYNFNADKLEIVLNKSEHGSPAMTNDMGELIIEMNIFSTLPENVQRFIIAHELQHILNNDFAEVRMIKRGLRKTSMTPIQRGLFEKYERFQEKRADVYAALKGEYWAEGYLAFAKEGIKRCTNDLGITHPTYKERKQIAQNILDHANGIQTV